MTSMPVLYLYAGVKFDVPCGLPAGIGESGRSSPFYVARTYALSASTVLYVRISTDFMVRKVLRRSDILRVRVARGSHLSLVRTAL